MTRQPPSPLTDPPRPQPRLTTHAGEDHEPTLAGGARYALAIRAQPPTARRITPWGSGHGPGAHA
jgi:hypothetical protein